MRYVVILVLLLSFAVPAKAVTTIGGTDCGGWLTAREEAYTHAWQYQFGLSGLLSGMAIESRKEFWDSGNGITPDQVFYWMDNYCRKNPLRHINEGAFQLFRERTTD